MDKRNVYLRSFSGVLLGFVAMATGSVLGPLAIHSAFPLDRLLEPGRFSPTPLFMGLQLLIAFTTAVIAGFLCRNVAQTRSSAFILAAIILCLSLTHALLTIALPSANPSPRIGNEPPDVMSDRILAAQPILFTFSGPALLVVGIILGSYRTKHKS